MELEPDRILMLAGQGLEELAVPHTFCPEYILAEHNDMFFCILEHCMAL